MIRLKVRVQKVKLLEPYIPPPGYPGNQLRELERFEARVREKAERRAGWEARALGLKILVNAASYGVFVEVNVKRQNGEMEICGLDSEESFEEDGAKLEEAGELFSPLLGATITSGAHLLLALLDSVAVRTLAEVVYQDTDSAFVAPSSKAVTISAAFDSLNPYSVPVPFLKDETPAHAGTVSFFGLSSKRYCLFEREKNGRVRILKASDHGLGMYQVPSDREEFTKRVWERLVRAALDSEDDPSEGFHYLPATSQFALTTPALLPRVSRVEGMKPFNFLTICYHDAAAISEGVETFELRPFVSPKEPAWLALGDEDGTKTWAHVVEGFSRHRDRKYLVGADGRIIRRDVVVRKSSLVGLGKEGTKLGARLKLGKAARSEPSVFVDWKRRLLAMGRAEARQLNLPWPSVTRWKRSLRKNRDLREDALARLKWALVGTGVFS